MILDLPRFLQAQQPQWTELEALLERIRDFPLTEWRLDELQRFHLLYQRACSDLMQLQTFSSEPDLVRYLEGIVARAYSEIHESRKERIRLNPLRWFLIDFPRAFQRRWRAFIIAVLMTTLGGLFGAFVVFANPATKEIILPFSHLLGSPNDRVKKEESATKDELAGGKASFSGYLMVNNIRVSIFAFALGISFGIGTTLILFYNGVILGAVIYDYLQAGEGLFLTGWLLPHGSVEIPAILLAGQCGMVIGYALIGRGSRLPMRTRIREIAHDVTQIIVGVGLLLIWAGVVEAFISQYHAPILPYWIKISFGAVQLALLALLLFRRLPAEKEAHA